MVNTVDKKMRTAFLGVLLCAFLSGCGREDIVLISEEESISRMIGETESVKETDLPPEEKMRSEELWYVYVCGAVVSPGVVEIAPGGRADDALRAAGGFAAGAKEDYVNLAARVEDGQMLYFPTVEEAEELSAAYTFSSPEEKAAGDRLVNLNTADIQTLCTLPGIGEARAADIIAYREEKGFFKTPEEIMRVPGIKENAYEKLKDKITTR